MSDAVFVTGLALHAYHGVMQHEAKVGQTFRLDLVLDIDLTTASRTDKIAHTVGYDQVVDVATKIFCGRRYRLVEAAAVAHEPHRIAFYLYDLASEFHALWTKGRDLPYLRFIMTNDAEIPRARLAMVQGVVSVMASGLAVLGVHAPTEMR